MRCLLTLSLVFVSTICLSIAAAESFPAVKNLSGNEVTFAPVEAFSLNVRALEDHRWNNDIARFSARTERPDSLVKFERPLNRFLVFRFDDSGYQFTKDDEAVNRGWHSITNTAGPVRGTRLIDRDKGVWLDLIGRIPHADAICAVSPDGSRVVTIASDRKFGEAITVFEVETGRTIINLASGADRYESVTLQTPNRLVISSRESDYGIYPHRFEVFNLVSPTNGLLSKLATKELFAYTRGAVIAESPDGQFLAIERQHGLYEDLGPSIEVDDEYGSDVLNANPEEYPWCVSIVDSRSLREIAWIPCGEGARARAAAFSDDGVSLAINEQAQLSGQPVASASWIRVFDLPSGRERSRFAIAGPVRRFASSGGLQWFPDRDMLLTAGGEIIDVAGREVIAVADPKNLRFESDSRRQPLIYSQTATDDGVEVLTYEMRQLAVRFSVNGLQPALDRASISDRKLTRGGTIDVHWDIRCPNDLNVQEIKDDLESRMAVLLARYGMTRNKTAEVVLSVTYEERRGPALPLARDVNASRHASLQMARGRDGQPVLATSASLVFDWTDRQGATLYHRANFQLDPATTVPSSGEGKTTTRHRRDAEVKHFLNRTFGQPLPVIAITANGEIMPFRMQFDTTAAR